MLEPYPEAKMLHYMGHHIYKDINIPIKYTGKIIAVDGFIMDYIGVDRIRSFEKIVEWTFKDGRFESTIELSHIIAEFRTELHNKIENKKVDSIFSHIKPQEFDLLLNVRDAWWLNLI